MHSIFVFLAPLAIAVAPYASAPWEGAGAAVSLDPGQAQAPTSQPAASLPVWNSLDEAFRPRSQSQVRIERRVIVRISPRQPAESSELLDQLPQAPISSRFREVGMPQCIAVKRIAGVQAMGNSRLLLFLNNRRVISASLAQSCRARDFYSGFYVERDPDGMLCAGRDVLHSRAGVNCELRGLHRLVAVEE